MHLRENVSVILTFEPMTSKT